MSLAMVSSVLLALLVSVATALRAQNPTSPIDCHNLNSQRSLALDKMLGLWYAVEVVEHFTQEERTGHAELPQCPIFILKQEMRNISQPPLIRLLWKEGEAYSVEYSLFMPEEHHKGYWSSSGQQNGSLAENSRYRQFSGTVHIMRATGDHAVLTFCSKTELQVFSVLLSREKTMKPTEVKSINNMLARRGLPVTYTKSTCRSNGSTTIVLDYVVAMFALLITTKLLH